MKINTMNPFIYCFAYLQSPRRRDVAVCSRRRKAREPGEYEVRVVTPPPQSLGVHLLDANMQNGDTLTLADTDYVVTTVVSQYKLAGGKYRKEHNRLDVQPMSRWLLNTYLNTMLDGNTKGGQGGPGKPKGRGSGPELA